MASEVNPATVYLFEDEEYGGKEKELNEKSPDQPDLTKDYSSGVSSIIVKQNAKKWQVFTGVNYYGAKVTLEPGRRYTSRDAMGLDNPVKSMRRFQENGDLQTKCSEVNPTTVLLFEDEGYGGKVQELNEKSPDQPNLTNDFTSGVSSIILKENAKKWQVFTRVGYDGANVTLEPGRRYTSRDAMGLDNPVRSMKRLTKNGDIKENNVEKTA